MPTVIPIEEGEASERSFESQKEIMPFDFQESEKFMARNRIFNADELVEMMTQAEKTEELKLFDDRRNKTKLEVEREQLKVQEQDKIATYKKGLATSSFSTS